MNIDNPDVNIVEKAIEAEAAAEERQEAADDLREEQEEFNARPPEERVTAIQAIRTFRKDNALALTYRCTAPNPYKDDDSKLVEIYADDRGNEYWVNPADNLLVQAGPSARLHPTQPKCKPEERLPVSELRQLAVQTITQQVAAFPSFRSSLHSLEDNRNQETYFFRWDDFSTPAKESELPPFVQVGLYADGRIASFTNTLAK